MHSFTVTFLNMNLSQAGVNYVLVNG